MLIYAIVTADQRQSWKNEGHPFNRGDIVVREFDPGGDLKERMLKEDMPKLLVLEEDRFDEAGAKAFLMDLRGIKAWCGVPALVLLKADQDLEKNEAGVFFLRKPVEVSAFEEIIKAGNFVIPRRYARRDVKAPCAIVAVGKRVDCMMRDISVSGCKIDYAGELKVGSMVQLGFSLKFGYKSVFIKAIAKIVREIKGGYGLAFSTMDPQSRSVIMSYIKG
jgi:hypothetical protein